MRKAKLLSTVAAALLFGVGAVSLLNPASITGRQEDAAPIRPMPQLPFVGAPTHAREPRLGTHLSIICQIQRFDPMLLFLGDHGLDPAAIATAMTIPILHKGQT